MPVETPPGAMGLTTRNNWVQTRPPSTDVGYADAEYAVAADRVFDGDRILKDHALLVNGGVISNIIPRRSIRGTLPVLYEPDATIIPGLIDTHIHYMRWEAPLFLRYGVTTVRDVGNDSEWIFDQRRRAMDSIGPRILCVGPLIDGIDPGHRFVSRSCGSSAEAIEAVREAAESGADGIKLYHGQPLEWLADITAEAHCHGLNVGMHCLETGVVEPGRCGVDEFFHLDGILTDVWPDHPPGWLGTWGLPAMSATLDEQKRVADEIAELGMTSTPTLAYWESQWRIRARDYRPDDESPNVPNMMRVWQGTAPKRHVDAELWRAAFIAAIGFTRLLVERGVRLLSGTDVPFGAITPGLSLWREMSHLVRAGLSPTRALQTATRDAAAFFGKPEIGRLAAGSSADLVIVRGDPTSAIPEDPKIIAVARNGRLYRPAELATAAFKVAATVNDDPWAAQFREAVIP